MKPLIAVIENNVIATLTVRKTLIQFLKSMGYEVILLTSGSRTSIELISKEGIKVVDIGSSTQNPLDIFKYLFKLYSNLFKLRPALVLTFTIRPAIWGNLVTRFLAIPTITNITGIGPLFTSNRFSYRVARDIYRIALKRTKKIFFQNLEDQQIFLAKGFAKNSVTERIPGSGVDTDFFSPRPKKDTNSRFTFLFISRLVKDKGILEYVDACKYLKSKIDADFKILGPLWMQNLKDNTITSEELEAWQKSNIIQYLGESQDVRDYISDADCIVLPSYREGMSNVLLEASSMGKPCVTTDVTGCRDIIEDGVNGFLCEVKNSLDLAEKMLKMAKLTQLERDLMGQRGREKMIREFNKKIVVTAYINAIHNVLNQETYLK